MRLIIWLIGLVNTNITRCHLEWIKRLIWSPKYWLVMQVYSTSIRSIDSNYVGYRYPAGRPSPQHAFRRFSVEPKPTPATPGKRFPCQCRENEAGRWNGQNILQRKAPHRPDRENISPRRKKMRMGLTLRKYTMPFAGTRHDQMFFPLPIWDERRAGYEIFTDMLNLYFSLFRSLGRWRRRQQKFICEEETESIITSQSLVAHSVSIFRFDRKTFWEPRVTS